MFSKSVLCLWVSAAVFAVRVFMYNYYKLCLYYSVIQNHVCFYVRVFIAFPGAPSLCVSVGGGGGGGVGGVHARVCARRACVRAYVCVCTAHRAM